MVGADVVEVSPPFDGPGEITGGLGVVKGHPISVISSTSNWRQE